MNITYSVPISQAKPGETAIYRSPETAKSGLVETIDNYKSLKDMIVNSAEKYAKLNFLGTKQPSNQYSWYSYEETFNMAVAFGSGLLAKNLVSSVQEYRDMKLRFLGVLCKNRAEYLITDIAGILYNLTHVPLYDTLGPQAIEYILDQTKMEILICSSETLLKFVGYGKTGSVKTIISYDEIDPKVQTQLQSLNIAFYTYKEIISFGIKEKFPFAESSERDLYVISYTSGTTGNPKGAMMTHGNLLAVTAVNKHHLDWKAGEVYLSFLPMAHLFERLAVMMLINRGCAIGYYSGDPLKLKDDFVALKPHIVCLVPRILNKFHDIFQVGIAGLRGVKKWMVKRAIEKKLYNLNTANKLTHYTYDRLVFKKFKEALGGRIKQVLIGSAPTAKEVMDFMKIALSAPIIEGYGQTESSGASFLVNRNDYQRSGSVGGPSSMNEFKLVDIPEMNYISKDVDEKGVPTPRGEMCIRGPGVFVGYYKDEEKTKEALDADGWLHTGDVCMIQPNGAIKIIDRKKNIFKLSQGEYIAPEKLEGVYKTCQSVSEVFVWGESLQSFLVGVVVVEISVLKRWADEKGIKYSNEDELLTNKDIKAMVLEEMKMAGKGKQFTTFELIRNVILEKSPFATKDLLTTTFKMKRHEAKNYYKGQIEGMYKEGIVI